MSAFATVVHWDGKPVDSGTLNSINNSMRYRCPDGSWVWTDGAVGMAQADLATLPEDRPGIPVRSGPLRIVASCRIDNATEVFVSLPTGCRPVSGTDTALILAAYKAWGEDCVDRLIGDFAFVIWDSQKRQVFAARDLSGARPLYYYQSGSTLFLASDRSQILQDPSIPCHIDEAQIIDFFTPAHQMATGWDQGLFRDFHALENGHTLQAKDGQIHLRRYWTWEEKRPEKRKEEDVIEEYLHTLQQAIRCRLRSRTPVGMELSGGLDSGSVVSVAGQMSQETNTELHTFSSVFDEAREADERPGIEAVLSMYPQLIPHFIMADRMYGPQCMRPDWHPHSIMSPFEIWMPPAVHHLYDRAEQTGCRVMLNGRYGDELNNGAYIVYYDLLRRGRIGDVMQRLRIDRQRFGMHRTARSFLLNGLLPLVAPMSVLKKVLVSREQRMNWWGDFTLPNYISQTYREQILERDAAIRVKKIEDLNVRCPTVGGTLNLMFPPKIGVTMQYRQPIETRFPFLDRRIIEMVLNMPQDMKCNHAEPNALFAVRHHHQRAMAGILPEKVRVGNVKAVFDAAWRLNYSPQMARDWFTSRSNVHIFERGYVEPDSFMAAIDEFERPIGYLASMICLEGWFRALDKDGLLPAESVSTSAISCLV